MKYLLLLLMLTLPSAAWAKSDARFTYSGTPDITDGDSIYIGNTEIRLLCIDAVELHQSCTAKDGNSYPCGVMAKQELQRLIGSAKVNCRGKAHDKYKRPLVWCKVGNVSLNDEMVQSGWAISLCRSTSRQESEAKDAGRGIWQGQFDIPSAWRRGHPWKHDGN